MRRGLSEQPVPRFNVDLTAESSRSSLTEFELISNNDLKIIILSAKPKSCSIDPLPTWLLTASMSFYRPCITTIMNMSLKKGFFPSDFKKSIVRPLFKKETPTSLVGIFPILRFCQRHLKKSSPFKSSNISMTKAFMPKCNRPTGTIQEVS